MGRMQTASHSLATAGLDQYWTVVAERRHVFANRSETLVILKI